MAQEWYAARHGQDGNKRYGPVPLSELRDMIDSGRVRPDDLVWCEMFIYVLSRSPSGFPATAPAYYGTPMGAGVGPFGAMHNTLLYKTLDGGQATLQFAFDVDPAAANRFGQFLNAQGRLEDGELVQLQNVGGAYQVAFVLPSEGPVPEAQLQPYRQLRDDVARKGLLPGAVEFQVYDENDFLQMTIPANDLPKP
jgi:hypothetical protein